jgi:hypothetical protein
LIIYFLIKGNGTGFISFSYADNHLDDLHRLMPGGIGALYAKKRSNVLKNPHLVDWWFGTRLKEFFDKVLVSVLMCK